MSSNKKLKDPIYGYIGIPIEYMNEIIDTAIFQRLRRIIQTSYSPLYSSAVHNRFVHSLGVFHLGKIASHYLRREMINKGHCDDLEKTLDRLGKIFLLACLLHDVGHAPFSHTGEEFYLDDRDLHKKLMEVVNSDALREDLPKTESIAAAPHEIMSAIIGIEEFSGFFYTQEEKEFFARCITGYKFSVSNKINDLKNCFVLLLNSKVIDVDKLDYLIRDAYITGFATVNIDYQRLLSALTILFKENGRIELGYYKTAISVIENVVYAHDSERKWIQNHPVVLYENYIIKHVLSALRDKLDTVDKSKKLFSLESLSRDGQVLENGLRVRLLCDDDIIYLMKTLCTDELSDEYFERKKRMHPIWKSESEYQAYVLAFSGTGGLLTNFENAMEIMIAYLKKNTDSWIINDALIANLEHDLSALDKMESGDYGVDSTSILAQKTDKKKILSVANCLKKYAAEKGIVYKFVILKASQFNSGFSKSDFSKLGIVFPNSDKEDKCSEVGDIVSSLEAKLSKRPNFFYLFYDRGSSKRTDIDSDEICKRLLKLFFEN